MTCNVVYHRLVQWQEQLIPGTDGMNKRMIRILRAWWSCCYLPGKFPKTCYNDNGYCVHRPQPNRSVFSAYSVSVGFGRNFGLFFRSRSGFGTKILGRWALMAMASGGVGWVGEVKIEYDPAQQWLAEQELGFSRGIGLTGERPSIRADGSNDLSAWLGEWGRTRRPLIHQSWIQGWRTVELSPWLRSWWPNKNLN